jgi:hypothetical protein
MPAKTDIDAGARERKMLGPIVAGMASWQATSEGWEVSTLLPKLAQKENRKEKDLA